MKSKVSDIRLKLLHPRYHCSDDVVCLEVCMQYISITWHHQRSSQEGEVRHSYPAMNILRKAIVVTKKQSPSYHFWRRPPEAGQAEFPVLATDEKSLLYCNYTSPIVWPPKKERKNGTK